MHELAPDVWHLPLAPRFGVNAYAVGDVVVDAGLKGSAKKVLGQLHGRHIAAHALTHAHPDHAGGSRQVCDTLGVPCWAGVADVPAARAGLSSPPNSFMDPVQARIRWPGVEVARELREGDEVGGFTVLDAPGHTPGHIAFWRAHDRVLICGDVFLNMSLVTTRFGLHEPPAFVTADPTRNRESMRRLAELEPAIAGFGHGPVLTDAAPKLRAFVDGL
ncbi:MAG: MBL fold metallo-hydrolase [Solirubrobacteraceae bacterium MAG38_C4-C5]|nr:MBL fold metallo-hydrolase [Candidatus Siliceabacter maunaloa]